MFFACSYESDIAFIKEEDTGCINEEAIHAINQAAVGAIVAQRKLPSCFFFFISSSFTVSVAQAINRSGFSSDSKVLVISSISSSEMYKVNPFPVLAAPCQLIFHSNLFNTDEVALVTNLGKTSLAKGTTKKSKNAVLLKST